MAPEVLSNRLGSQVYTSYIGHVIFWNLEWNLFYHGKCSTISDYWIPAEQGTSSFHRCRLYVTFPTHITNDRLRYMGPIGFNRVKTTFYHNLQRIIHAGSSRTFAGPPDLYFVISSYWDWSIPTRIYQEVPSCWAGTRYSWRLRNSLIKLHLPPRHLCH